MVKSKYQKLLAAEAFAPTPATSEARKTALAMNLSPEARNRLAKAGARRAHARRKTKALWLSLGTGIAVRLGEDWKLRISFMSWLERGASGFSLRPRR